MAQVSDRVLQWLWNALQSDYHNPQATYTDAVSVLTAYPTLHPRTDVYTYNNGRPALLLCLSGTLPVTFRGTTYRFPLQIWVPHAHPHDAEGVIVLVVPGENMVTRPGQHVGVDGRVYHPYLRDWNKPGQQHVSSMVGVLRVLQEVFAREPPVVAKLQGQQQQQQQQQGGNSPVQRQMPRPPPKERPGSTVQSYQQQQPVEMPAGPNPPPKPPKVGEQARGGAGMPLREATPVQYGQREMARDGPPLPPLPHQGRPQGYQSPQLRQQGTAFATPPRQQSIHMPHGRDMHGYPRDGPVSPISPNGFGQQHGPDRYSHAPPLPQSAPYPSSHSQGKQPQQQQYQHMPAQQQSPRPPHFQQQQQQQQPQQHYSSQRQPLPMPPQSQHQPPPPQPQHYQQYPQPQQPPPKPAPAPDLLTDPFDVSLPTLTNTAAPPIPPNPEKEHLLTHLSHILVSSTTQKIAQTNSALPALRAQNQALQQASHQFATELAQLDHLDRVLASNEAILKSNMAECDNTILRAKTLPEPAVDDVLVAPTLVQNQLWSLEGEIAGLNEALWVLQRAVGSGRMGGAEFVRVNRALGRELFLKMALSRKIARGLGLDVGRGGGARGGHGEGEGFYS